ncbi:MAG TPA: hypothetical protein VKU41_09045 [Polyangiaceae bacterium]|nr:hypothetical protein [Polyangiaceae bacterium]
MNARALAVGSIASSFVGMTLVACFDLFHSTGDLRSACQLDAATAGCGPRSVDAGQTSFCAWTPGEARDHAREVCARLGACESPTGKNAFGPCMFEALLAFDCAANPNHPVAGKARDLWQCLSAATACADVDRCVFEGTGPGLCDQAGQFAACPGSPTVNLRVDCTDGGTPPLPRAAGENCALWGQTCDIVDGVAVCSGPSTGQAGGECSQGSGCYGGAAIHWCPGLGNGIRTDVGIDCASNGAQACAGFPADPPSWVACIPLADSSACPANAAASCDEGGVAHSCPAGASERIDCSALLGQPGACQAGPLSPPFDWTSACAVSPPECTGDSCVDGGVVGCTRGARFATDCASLGLGPCSMVTVSTDDGGVESRAACGAH